MSPKILQINFQFEGSAAELENRLRERTAGLAVEGDAGHPPTRHQAVFRHGTGNGRDTRPDLIAVADPTAHASHGEDSGTSIGTEPS